MFCKREIHIGIITLQQNDKSTHKKKIQKVELIVDNSCHLKINAQSMNKRLDCPKTNPVQKLAPNVGHCSSVTAFVSCIRVPDLFNAVDPTGY